MDTYIVLHVASVFITLYLQFDMRRRVGRKACSGQTNGPQYYLDEHLTLLEGETAILPCSIYNPGGYKVNWNFDDLKTRMSYVLTQNERLFIDDARFNVRHRTDSASHDHYDLSIENLTYDDQGQYRCVHLLSHNQPTIKTVTLTIQAPTKIIDELSSKDVTAVEGDRVMLVCNMTGIPEPEVTWYKVSNGNREVVQTSGQVFMMQQVTSLDHGTYQCSGYNGAGSAATRSVKVNVYFRPSVSVPAKSISQPPGSSAIFECEISANPFGEARWVREADNDIDLFRMDKYKAQLSDGSLETTKILSLKVMDLQLEDYGQYVCFAVNREGVDEVSITLEDDSKHGVTDRSTYSSSGTTGTHISSTSSSAIYDETTVANSSPPRKDVSNETAIVTRQEYYRDQMLTNMLWRNLIKREHRFYDYIKRILEKREH